MRFRPRLVVPREYASRWRGAGLTTFSPSGRLAFIEIDADEQGVDRLLEELTDASADWLRRHPNAPPLLSVARYEREPKGENDYLMLPVSLGLYLPEYRPYVDCEDLEIGVSAEYRVRRGLPARPIKKQVAPRMWHILTDMGNGQIQDSTGYLLSQGRGSDTWNR